ncbi:MULTISPECIES: TetR/AcrR family transcriptional regulator [Pseudomonas]|uniref:Transcriptional regulator, TetR family n=1 Tax=Pseudomonas panipatensis TaxID=428992 RepID=A0A1G8KRD7_9PSED|nr:MULTISPECIES: TetR/AcrR family transcriptional regulator [Pseudomonas]SDI45957.1 transcriptional regulator, TetR family [Pseudomonas panipatensis]SMP70437.1 transcriptional regulator, TetR family [Pseudomonas panipatensis]
MNTAKCISSIPTSSSAGSRFARNRPKALELFAQRGFAQVSLRELARHLELTAGSLYSHCASKEELLLEFIEEHYLALLSLFDRRYRRECPRATLQAVIQGLVFRYTAHPQHFQLATRDIVFLSAEQRQYIDLLREQLRQRLDASLGAAGFAHPVPAEIPILELFEHLPLWLASHAMNEEQRVERLMQLLTAPLSRGT